MVRHFLGEEMCYYHLKEGFSNKSGRVVIFIMCTSSTGWGQECDEV